MEDWKRQETFELQANFVKLQLFILLKLGYFLFNIGFLGLIGKSKYLAMPALYFSLGRREGTQL